MATHTTTREDLFIEKLDCDDADRVSEIIERLDREITMRDEAIDKLAVQVKGLESELSELKARES